MNPEQLSDLLNSFEKESNSIREQITDICYFMKGGITWNDAWGLSFEDREAIIKIVNKREKEKNPNAKEYL
jgi:hypothetical protein